MISLVKQGPTGARIAGIRPEALFARDIATEIYRSYNLICRLTCGTDGQHKEGSLHFVGLAIDIGLPPTHLLTTILQDLRLNLEDEFDVIVEGDHIHIEFQPKKGLNLNA